MQRRHAAGLIVCLAGAVITAALLGRLPAGGSSASRLEPLPPGRLPQAQPKPSTRLADGSSAASTDSPRRGSDPGSSEPAAGRTPGAAKARISINFAGDVNFTGALLSALRANPAGALRSIAPALGDADLTVVNLETAIGDSGTPAPKTYTFRAPPAALTALRDAGVDVASLANNHGLDYGPTGVDEALAASRASGLPLIGVGHDEAEAMAPHRVTIRGHRVAVIGATQVLDDNLIPAWTATPNHAGLASAKRADQLVAAVRTARPSADTLVVFLHWGIETHTCPSTDQQALARSLVAAGADVVVGGHAHRVQGAGRLGGAIVDYGLGNFAFAASSGPSATSGILHVELGGGAPPSYQWRPAVIGTGNVPAMLHGSQADAAVANWNGLRSCTGLAA